jgi:hypothetical protein
LKLKPTVFPEVHVEVQSVLREVVHRAAVEGANLLVFAQQRNLLFSDGSTENNILKKPFYSWKLENH